MGMFKLGSMTLKSLFTKAPTRRYPAVKREPFERTRGHIEMIDMKACILCGMCERKCPAHAISVDRGEETWTYFAHKCVACNDCVEFCPTDDLRMDNHYSPIMTDPQPEVHRKPPLTPEELAEKERKEAEKKAKIEAALAAKKAREEAEKDKTEE